MKSDIAESRPKQSGDGPTVTAFNNLIAYDLIIAAATHARFAPILFRVRE
jgi:hypothetical protein